MDMAAGPAQCLLAVPPDFEADQYLHLNPDLTSLRAPEKLEEHYCVHGHMEGRIYRDPHFDPAVFKGPYKAYANDIRQKKNETFDALLLSPGPIESPPLLVVDHDNSLAGASLYALNMVRRTPGSVLLVPSEITLKASLCAGVATVLSYHGDPTFLYHLIKRLRPRTLLFNSVNHAMTRAMPFFPEAVLHSHEIRDHYLPWLQARRAPHFVVTERIAASYLEAGASLIPWVQPPFLDHHRIRMLSEAPPREASDGGPTVAMCGTLSARKQPSLFAKAAVLAQRQGLPLRFLWVGGSGEAGQRIFSGTPVSHVADTAEPWQYLSRLADIFVLTSSFDPCPYVILEALFVGLPTVTFRDAILQDHPALGGQHLMVPGTPSPSAVLEVAQQLQGAPRRPPGREYVLQNFSEPHQSYLDFLRLQQ